MCEDTTWAYILRKIDHDTYAVFSAREVSLVDRMTLEALLRRTHEGGTHGLGGGHVG